LVVLDDVLKPPVRSVDAIFESTMDFGSFLARGGVQRHEGVAKIMAQHPCGERGFGPFAAAKCVGQAAVPATGFSGRAAPVTASNKPRWRATWAIFANRPHPAACAATLSRWEREDHVVLKIFEPFVGRAAAGEIFGVVMQQQIAPPLGVRAAEMAEGIHREPLVRRVADVAEDGREKQGHGSRELVSG